MSTVPQTLAGKTGLVFGVANKRSIAWGIAQAWAAAGAKLIFSYQGERIKGNVEELVEELGADTPFYPCDVSRDEDITGVFQECRTHADRVDLLLHSVAFAPKEALEADFLSTTREAYRMAHDISAYSLVALAREAAPLMTDGGSIIAMTYYGSEKVIPRYNVMGVAKASLEASTRYLAYDLGKQKVRVNCISAGPMNTLAARGISGFNLMLKHYEQRAPLGRSRARWRNLARWACSWRATARRPSPGRRSTWTAATRSSGCDGEWQTVRSLRGAAGGRWTGALQNPAGVAMVRPTVFSTCMDKLRDFNRDRRRARVVPVFSIPRPMINCAISTPTGPSQFTGPFTSGRRDISSWRWTSPIDTLDQPAHTATAMRHVDQWNAAPAVLDLRVTG